MNRNFHNSYRGGWTDMPFDDFSWGQFNYDHQFPRDRGHHYADNMSLPHQMPAHYADDMYLPHQMPAHYADDMYLPRQMPAHYDDNMYLPHQRPVHYDDMRFLPPEHYDDMRFLPHQIPDPYDDMRFLPHQTLAYYADNRHLTHQRQKHYADKRPLPHQTPKDFADKRNLTHQRPEEHNDGKRHRRILSKLCKQSTKDGRPVENMSHEAPRFRYKEVPAEGSKRKVRDINDAKDHSFKRDIGEVTKGKYMKMNNGIRRPLKSSKPEINALSNSVESLVQIPELTPPSGHVASPKMALVPAEGSNFEPQSQHVSTSLSQESKGKEHHKFENATVEKNDQPQSTLAAVESTFEPKSQQVIQTEMSKGKVHNEIQNHIVDSNDQQRSISMDLHDPAGSMTNTQVEAVNSDSAAIKIVTEPLTSAQPVASVSSLKPLNEHGLHTEIEPQVLEVVPYNEQHPIEETNIELLPSKSMEIGSASEVSSETETVDGSSQVEEDMDVLTDELEIIQLPQVSVCLKCGDEGFEETLVYCNKCEDYALHRYCLDGPVIFTDEVIWFCEDCEVVVDTENGEVDFGEECAADADPQPIADPIWRGSLQVFHKNDNKITRLMGHLSSLACPKVLEETRHLPNVLYADLLHRSAVWPESFRKFGTNNLSIGLYFFPQNERVERHFDQLVDEMISNDLAIRARIEKAELFIFPSTMLPSQYKRFQSKYYLWGVFKRKQVTNTIIDA